MMFAQEDIYSGYMDKFFADHRHSAISWIHDLGRGRHGTASQTLLVESKDAHDLQMKHVCGHLLLSLHVVKSSSYL